MAEERDYSRGWDFGRHNSKRLSSPPQDRVEYERYRRRRDEYSYGGDDRNYGSHSSGGYRPSGAHEKAAYGFLSHEHYVAVARIARKEVETAIRNSKDSFQRDQQRDQDQLPPPPPSRPAPPPRASDHQALIEQLANEKAEKLRMQEELDRLRSASAKRKEQLQKRKARLVEKKQAAAAASSSEEDKLAEPSLEALATTTSEQLAGLTFKEVLAMPKAAAAAMATRRKSSPAVMEVKQEPGSQPVSLPVTLVSAILRLHSINKTAVVKAIGECYSGPAANLSPLWTQLFPDDELPTNKQQALEKLYVALKDDISKLKMQG
eukprot:gene4939-5180_t